MAVQRPNMSHSLAHVKLDVKLVNKGGRIFFFPFFLFQGVIRIPNFIGLDDGQSVGTSLVRTHILIHISRLISLLIRESGGL